MTASETLTSSIRVRHKDSRPNSACSSSSSASALAPDAPSTALSDLRPLARIDMPPNQMSFNDRLLHALLAIHATPARLINPGPGGSGSAGDVAGGSGVGASSTREVDASRRRASVAIIIRIRPSSSSMLPTSPFDLSENRTPHEPRWREHAPALTGPDAHAPSLPPVSSTSSTHPQGILASSEAAFNTAKSGILGGQIGDQSSASASATSAAMMEAREAVDAGLQDKVKAFFSQDWVREGTPEVLFIKRASRSSDRWSAHIAFPGGRQEPDDEGRLYTAMRETWEEVGVDLAEKEYLPIGQLDDREITTSLGKRLLMVLSPFVFLHTSPHTPQPELQPSEVASAHWIPLMLLHSPHVRWGDVVIDISSRLAPRSPIIKAFLRVLVGNMHFKCVLLPNEPVAIGIESPEDARGGKRPDLKLWGLTLGMTLDLISHMSAAASAHELPATSPATYPFLLGRAAAAALPGGGTGVVKRSSTGVSSSPVLSSTPPISHLAPSMTSIFPRFSYPDINFFIFLFGFRYRNLVKRWTNRPSLAAITPGVIPVTPGSQRDRTVNWAGMALGQFYAAVRRALVVAIILRASVAAGGLAWAAYWVAKRIKAGK